MKRKILIAILMLFSINVNAKKLDINIVLENMSVTPKGGLRIGMLNLMIKFNVDEKGKPYNIKTSLLNFKIKGGSWKELFYVNLNCINKWRIKGADKGDKFVLFLTISHGGYMSSLVLIANKDDILKLYFKSVKYEPPLNKSLRMSFKTTIPDNKKR